MMSYGERVDGLGDLSAIEKQMVKERHRRSENNAKVARALGVIRDGDLAESVRSEIEEMIKRYQAEADEADNAVRRLRNARKVILARKASEDRPPDLGMCA
jgi:hypothetical protein